MPGLSRARVQDCELPFDPFRLFSSQVQQSMESGFRGARTAGHESHPRDLYVHVVHRTNGCIALVRACPDAEDLRKGRVHAPM